MLLPNLILALMFTPVLATFCPNNTAEISHCEVDPNTDVDQCIDEMWEEAEIRLSYTCWGWNGEECTGEGYPYPNYVGFAHYDPDVSITHVVAQGATTQTTFFYPHWARRTYEQYRFLHSEPIETMVWCAQPEAPHEFSTHLPVIP